MKKDNKKDKKKSGKIMSLNNVNKQKQKEVIIKIDVKKQGKK